MMTPLTGAIMRGGFQAPCPGAGSIWMSRAKRRAYQDVRFEFSDFHVSLITCTTLKPIATTTIRTMIMKGVAPIDSAKPATNAVKIIAPITALID